MMFRLVKVAAYGVLAYLAYEFFAGVGQGREGRQRGQEAGQRGGQGARPAARRGDGAGPSAGGGRTDWEREGRVNESGREARGLADVPGGEGGVSGLVRSGEGEEEGARSRPADAGRGGGGDGGGQAPVTVSADMPVVQTADDTGAAVRHPVGRGVVR